MTDPAPQAGRHGDFDGWWLSNAAAEAFVIAEPYPRLVAFRLYGRDSPLHVSSSQPYFGVRTWFMEPLETEQSELPSERPSVGTVRRGALRLTGADEPVTGLRLTMDFALDEAAARLTITHALENRRDVARRMAPWAINAVAAKGVGLTTWRQEERRSFILFHDTDPREATLIADPQVLAVDYRRRPTSPFCKVGTDTRCGWGAFVWNGMALKSSVAHVADATYPEGGGTVTFFSSQPLAEGRFGELENVGPLTDVQPGGTVQLVQTLSLIDGMTGADPGAWAQAIAGSR